MGFTQAEKYQMWKKDLQAVQAKLDNIFDEMLEHDKELESKGLADISFKTLHASITCQEILKMITIK